MNFSTVFDPWALRASRHLLTTKLHKRFALSRRFVLNSSSLCEMSSRISLGIHGLSSGLIVFSFLGKQSSNPLNVRARKSSAIELALSSFRMFDQFWDCTRVNR